MIYMPQKCLTIDKKKISKFPALFLLLFFANLIFSWGKSLVRDRLQILLLILSKFKEINQVLLSLTSSENWWLSIKLLNNNFYLNTCHLNRKNKFVFMYILQSEWGSSSEAYIGSYQTSTLESFCANQKQPTEVLYTKSCS